MSQINRLQTIDADTLQSTAYEPVSFVVDDLLPQGLHLLAGAPKIGKSWLALWLAVTVAKGEAVWGMGVKQGTTLYLCLEDSTLRIQNRLFEITEDAPANVHFTTQSDILGKGLEEQLCAFLSEHPDTVLVIIDTLQMIRGAGYDNTYAASSRTSYPSFPPAPKTHSFRRSSFSVQNRFAGFWTERRAKPLALRGEAMRQKSDLLLRRKNE